MSRIPAGSIPFTGVILRPRPALLMIAVVWKRWLVGRVGMDVGEVWAYREKAGTEGAPIRQVEILQFDPKRRSKVRIRYLDGDERGLDEWVTKVRLKVPWADADAWLHDERRYIAARGVSLDAEDTAEYQAAESVLVSYARRDGVGFGYRWGERALLLIDDLAGVAAELGSDADAVFGEPLAFVDRHDRYVAPWPVALRLARRLAERHADEVVAAVAKEEAELQAEALNGRVYHYRRGGGFEVPAEECLKDLQERQPIFDLVRAWCGRSAVERFDELMALRAEVDRLRLLLESAARWLDEAGERRGATRLRQELGLFPDAGRR